MGLDTTTVRVIYAHELSLTNPAFMIQYIVAIAAGFGIVSAILFFKSRRRTVKFLQNSETKYEVELIEKEVKGSIFTVEN